MRRCVDSHVTCTDVKRDCEYVECASCPGDCFDFCSPIYKNRSREDHSSPSYLNDRTAKYIHFFCAGYSGYNHDPSVQNIGEVSYDGGTVIPWSFSQKDFANFVNEMEGTTSWRYSGEVDAILTDPEYPLSGGNPKISFEKVIVFDLERMITDGAIDKASRLFEAIVAYARTQENPSTDNFSNRRGVRVLGASGLDSIIDAVPKMAGAVLKKGLHYRVQSLQR